MGDMMSRLRATLATRAAVVGAVVLLGGCSDSGPSSPPREVIVYTSVDEVFSRPIAERFERESGVRVRLVPDTEETKSTGLVNRLIAEKERPRADVFWSGDPVRAAILKKRGIAAAYHSPNALGMPEQFRDPEGFWTGFSARARVLIYNRDLVAEADRPRSLMDLLDQRFEGAACLANPLFGTTSIHAAALFAVLGHDGARRFFEGFAANGGEILSSNGEVRRRVAAAECAVGITDSDDYNVARLEGQPVGVVFPDAEGMGTLVIPNAAVRIAGGPNPEPAAEFIDFLLTPEVERALAESEAAQMPVRPGVGVPNGVRSLGSITPMRVDYTELAPIMERISRSYLQQWVDRNLR